MDSHSYAAFLHRHLIGPVGLGVNGHVAFNEPGSPWDLRTHLAHLSPATRAVHEREAREPWAIPAFTSLSFSKPVRVDDFDGFDEECRRGFEAKRERLGDEHHAEGIDGLMPSREAHA